METEGNWWVLVVFNTPAAKPDAYRGVLAVLFEAIEKDAVQLAV